MHDCNTIAADHFDKICTSRLKAEGILAVQGHNRAWTCLLAPLDSGPVTATIRRDEHTDEVVVQLGNAIATRHVRVAIESTACGMGGLRWWFLCHGCDLRTMHVYARLQGPLLICRACAGIPYETLTASRLERIRLARDKVARQLGCEPGPNFQPFAFPPQPARMRYERYARLADKLWRLDQAALQASERWVRWMQGRFFPAGRVRASARRTAARRHGREER